MYDFCFKWTLYVYMRMINCSIKELPNGEYNISTVEPVFNKHIVGSIMTSKELSCYINQYIDEYNVVTRTRLSPNPNIELSIKYAGNKFREEIINDININTKKKKAYYDAMEVVKQEVEEWYNKQDKGEKISYDCIFNTINNFDFNIGDNLKLIEKLNKRYEKCSYNLINLQSQLEKYQ